MGGDYIRRAKKECTVYRMLCVILYKGFWDRYCRYVSTFLRNQLDRAGGNACRAFGINCVQNGNACAVWVFLACRDFEGCQQIFVILGSCP